jgi:hypothetical protein
LRSAATAIAAPFNCSGMYRGFTREDGILHAIYGDPTGHNDRAA